MNSGNRCVICTSWVSGLLVWTTKTTKLYFMFTWTIETWVSHPAPPCIHNSKPNHIGSCNMLWSAKTGAVLTLYAFIVVKHTFTMYFSIGWRWPWLKLYVKSKEDTWLNWSLSGDLFHSNYRGQHTCSVVTKIQLVYLYKHISNTHHISVLYSIMFTWTIETGASYVAT